MVSNSYTLYSFTNYKLGLISKLEIRANKFVLGTSEIKISLGITLSEEEFKKIEMFQFVIFKLLTSRGNVIEEIQDHLKVDYCVVPVVPTTGFNYKIDFDYINSIINFKLDLNHGDNNECLLWSNKEHKFICKVDEFKGSLNDKIGDHLDDERISADVEKGLIQPTDNLKTYFETKYSIKLDGLCKSSLILGIYEAVYLFNGLCLNLSKSKIINPVREGIDNYYGGKPIIMPMSIYTYTTIPKSIVNDFAGLYVNFSYMLILLSSFKFEERFNLGLNYSVIAEQLLFKEINNVNNLTESSLGRNLIKCLSTIHIAFEHMERYVEKGLVTWPDSIIKDIVNEKDSLICNEKLHDLVCDVGMARYIVFRNYFNLFYLPKIQDESIAKLECMKDIVDDNVLLLDSDKWKNPFYIIFKRPQEETHVLPKMYAHTYLALSSEVYNKHGLKATMDFYLSTSLFEINPKSIKGVEKSNVASLIPKENYFFTNVQYFNILKEDEISKIEKILNYTFKHKALIERTFIHFSMAEGKFSAPTITDLQELIGDAILDVFFETYLIYELDMQSPTRLRNTKGPLVSNENLGKVLKSAGLLDFYKADPTINFPKKHYGDICESVFGAVFIDMNLNYSDWAKWFNEKFKDLCFEMKDK